MLINWRRLQADNPWLTPIVSIFEDCFRLILLLMAGYDLRGRLLVKLNFLRGSRSIRTINQLFVRGCFQNTSTTFHGWCIIDSFFRVLTSIWLPIDSRFLKVIVRDFGWNMVRGVISFPQMGFSISGIFIMYLLRIEILKFGGASLCLKFV